MRPPKGKGQSEDSGKRQGEAPRRRQLPGEGENHCIAPSGTELPNEFYDVSEPIVAPFCTQVPSGDWWAVTSLWSMSHTFEVVAPGFVPAGDTPLEDLVAKFRAVRYVIDPGTGRGEDRRLPEPPRTVRRHRRRRDPIANSITLGTLKPLPVGAHVVDVYWVLRGMHCDGFGDVIPNIAYQPGRPCL